MSVGFDRKIRAAWLDQTARLAAQGLSVAAIRERLDDALDGQVSGNGHNSARGKTKTVLMRVWVNAPDRAAPLRDDALAVVGGGGLRDLRPLHWGMCLATYPFFRDLAAVTGRLLALQETVALAAITRRIVERRGARSTVLRASQRVVRSMVEWGVLGETGRRGVFRAGSSLSVRESRRGRRNHQGGRWLASWLVEAALLASGRDSMRLALLARHPMLFPFGERPTPADVMTGKRLDLFREGGGEDVVALRTPTGVRD